MLKRKSLFPPLTSHSQIAPIRISATSSDLLGKSCSKPGSPSPLMLARTDWRKVPTEKFVSCEYSLDQANKIKTPSFNSKRLKATKNNEFVAILMFPCQYLLSANMLPGSDTHVRVNRHHIIAEGSMDIRAEEKPVLTRVYDATAGVAPLIHLP